MRNGDDRAMCVVQDSLTHRPQEHPCEATQPPSARHQCEGVPRFPDQDFHGRPVITSWRTATCG